MKTRMPEYYCRACISVVYEEDKQCLECASAKPTDGWPLLSSAIDPWLGKRIGGDYLVTNRVGRGASAVVYRAESLKIGRQFAIKVIDLAASDSGRDPELLRARLDREVGAIGRLRNPHTVQFYDVIEPAEGWVGIVMDFIEGETLEKMVRRDGPMSMERALRLLRQVANGLHEVHEIGLIHRDLKPENIMVETLPAGDDFAHVVDFGIVWADDGVQMTQGFVGTPLYSSPEQAIGGAVDRRSDIYSLGAILFFLLTGRPPFESRNVLEVLSQHVKKMPPKLAELMPGMAPPAEIQDLVSAMLSKSPDARPSDLSEVIFIIDDLVDLTTSSTGEEQYNQYGRSLVEDSDAGDTAHGPFFEPAEGVSPSDSVPGDPITDTFQAPVTGVFSRSLDEQSDSFVESLDRDETGPKAAIFRLRTSGIHPARLANGEVGPDESDEADVGIEQPTGETGIGKLRVPFWPDTVWTPGSRHRFAYWDGADNIVLLKMTPRSQFEIPIGPEDQISSLAMSNRYLVLGYRTGEVARINMSTGAGSVLFENVRRLPMTAVACDERDFLMLAGSASGRVYMLRTFRESSDWVCIQTGSRVTDICVSPQGDAFAVVREGRHVELFDASSPRRAFATFETEDAIQSLAFSRDSHLLALALANRDIRLQQTFMSRHVMSMEDVDPSLLGVYFNRDNDLLGICGA